jgi:hypothetical protein
MFSADAELSGSSVTFPHGVAMGPCVVSQRRLVRSALGCPRQFKSVAHPEGVDLHRGTNLFRVAWTYHLRGCKGFDKCTLRKESLFQAIRLIDGNLVTTFTSSK